MRPALRYSETIMSIARLGWILTLAGMCHAAHAAPRARLLIGTEHVPPLVTLAEGGRLAGIATDKVRAIMERTGIDYSIEILPFKRAYLLARTRTDMCIYSLTRLPEREALFKWVGPIHHSDWTLFGRAGRDYGVKTLEDARKYRIGAFFGDVRGETLASQGFTVSTVRERIANPRKLLVDRIDLWASSLQMGGNILADNGWETQIVPVLTIKRTELYLACSRAVPDALVAHMNAALEAMEREGVSAQIERKYERPAAKAR